MLRFSILATLVAATLTSALAHAQDKPAADSPRPQQHDQSPPVQREKRVGILALDDSVRTQQLDEQVAEDLAGAGLEVVGGFELQSAIEASIVPPPSSELAGRFSTVSTAIGEGFKAFFYERDRIAIERLSPVFDLGITHREVLARRPDLADQIYEAGIVLLRAYDNSGQDEEMEAVGSILVKTFPSRSPKPNTIPPDVITYLQGLRAKMARAKSELEFVGVGNGTCTGYVNGARVVANSFAVAPDFDYFLRLDCGASEVVVWKVRVGAGERTVVPVPSINPLEYEMTSSTLDTRRETEDYMATLAHWADLDAIVGVSRKAASGEDGVLVARMERGVTSWSDGVQNQSVRTALRRVFPELAGDLPSSELSQSSGSSTTDWLGWTLAGAGLATAAGGSVLVVLAEQRTGELRCTPPSSNPLPRSECDENILDGLSAEEANAEYDRILAEVRRNRIIGWSLVGVGAASAGYGIFRLVTADDEPEPALVIVPSFGPTGSGASMRITF